MALRCAVSLTRVVAVGSTFDESTKQGGLTCLATVVDDTAAAAKAAEENLKVLQNKLKLNALGDEELRALVSPADCDFSYDL